MAAAAFLIQDVGVPGESIHILETLNVPGGVGGGGESPVQPGYVTRRGPTTRLPAPSLWPGAGRLQILVFLHTMRPGHGLG
jgi:myosin-crossreactive antigen